MFSIVFMLCLSLSLRGIVCIQDCDSGCSDNHVGCTRAGLYKRGNSGDMQTGVRGPSINLTGCRSCQEYERMLWSTLLSGRVSCCTHTATVPPSTTGTSGLAEQSVYVHLHVCVWNHREALISLAQNLREERGGDITAQHSHQTVCLTVP